ncbi:MAG: sulfatase-like hydrolase/transferase [Spirochaetota bacterium]
MPRAANESGRPNVIVFFTDQQRADTTGAHGNPMGLTPTFDRLAREGTHFANTFTCQPVCAPARATLQTGRFSTATGVWRNGIGLDPAQPRVATAFRDAGYATGYIGKWHLSTSEPVPPAEQVGYDYWMGANLLEFESDAYDCNLYDADGAVHHLPGYRVDAQTDLAIRFIDEHRDDPFFLFLSYLEPHHQNHVDAYPAPPGYAERYSDPWMPADLRALGGSAARHLPGYYGMVKRLDEALGRLEDALRSLELLDDTVILYIADHGNHFKTRNGEYKRSCHDASIHVPCFVSGPGFRGGGRVEELVSLVDIPATLLAAAGLDPLPGMHGRSLLDLVSAPGRRDGSGVAWPDHVFVQISEAETGRAIRTRRWKYGVTLLGDDDGDGKADESLPVREYGDIYTELHLYDLENDPCELENLIRLDSHSAVRDRMRRLLLERLREVEGRTPRIIEPTLVAGGQRRVTAAEVME